jgi:hypothetical protein
MNIIHKENGPIDDVITTDAFEVHDLMFSIKDIIQCLFLCSATMYEFFNNPKCNSFAVTVNSSKRWVMATPMTMNSEYNECVIRNNPGDTPQSDVEKLRNTYTKPDDEHVLMFLSKGYVLDNFFISESYHDFLFTEGEPHVMITAEDIESLTLKNPNLE